MRYVSPYISLKPNNINSIIEGTACINVFLGEFSCKNVDLEDYINLPIFSAPTLANDIWGWTDSQIENKYALVGLSDGTEFVNISNPLNPVTLEN